MIYSPPAASASDLRDDTLWEGFLRAAELAFISCPEGISPSRTWSPSPQTSPLKGQLEGGNAIWTLSLVRQHLKGDFSLPPPAQVSVPYGITFPSRDVGQESARLLLPMSAHTGSHPGCLHPALPCLPIRSSAWFYSSLGPREKARLQQDWERCKSNALVLFTTTAILRAGVGWWCWVLSVLIRNCVGMFLVDLDVFPLVVGQLPKRK